MDITSIKKFMRPDKPLPQDFVRFVQLLLQGIALHAVEGDAAELSRFRDEISALSNGLTEDAASDQFLVAIGAALRALAEYNRRSSVFTKAKEGELQSILTMMGDTIAFLGSSSSTGVKALQLIEKDLEKASAIDDLRALREKLSGCLITVRNESIRVQEGARNRIDILQSRVQNATGALPVAQFSRDTMTGLPSRAAAEHSIASKIAEGKDFAVVLFIVDRLESINARFGRTIGDQILLSMAQHLAKQTSATSSLLRWSGPAFLQVLEIGSSFSAVERHAKKMAAIKMEKNIDTLGRSVILVVGCSFLLEKVTPQESAESVFRKLDAFLAARSGAAVDR